MITAWGGLRAEQLKIGLLSVYPDARIVCSKGSVLAWQFYDEDLHAPPHTLAVLRFNRDGAIRIHVNHFVATDPRRTKQWEPIGQGNCRAEITVHQSEIDAVLSQVFRHREGIISGKSLRYYGWSETANSSSHPPIAAADHTVHSLERIVETVQHGHHHHNKDLRTKAAVLAS